MKNHPIRETTPGKPSRPPHEDSKPDGTKQDDAILYEASAGSKSETESKTKSETDRKDDSLGQ